MQNEDPKYVFVVRDASKAPEGATEAAFQSNEPWVSKVVRRFFYNLAMGWAIDAIKEYTGKPQAPGDTELNHFLNFHQAGGESYESEGRSPAGDRPMLEETLEGILRTIATTDRSTVDYGENLSAEDLDAALAERGIIEC